MATTNRSRAPLAAAVAAAVLQVGGGVATEAVQKHSPATQQLQADDNEATNCAFASLDACPVIGCAGSDKGHAALNRRKRTMPEEATPTTLTFSGFSMLQKSAAALFPPKKNLNLSPAQRAQLKDLNFGGGTLSEGDLVQVSAFIVAPAHANSGESVNCGLKGTSNNDFHIPLGPTESSTDFDGIVAEMIPQQRDPGWTVEKLHDIQARKLKVLVSGQLLYDSLHVPNPDSKNVIGGQPHRMSLWEVHPVSEFLVCEKPSNACRDNFPADWTPIEKMTKQSAGQTD